jgi:hypothetical protein
MEEMTVDRATIAWSDTGSGEPTLLVHAGVFGAWFAPLAPRLPGAERRHDILGRRLNVKPQQRLCVGR